LTVAPHAKRLLCGNVVAHSASQSADLRFPA
jgi:hypothetical protein